MNAVMEKRVRALLASVLPIGSSDAIHIERIGEDGEGSGVLTAVLQPSSLQFESMIRAKASKWQLRPIVRSELVGNEKGGGEMRQTVVLELLPRPRSLPRNPWIDFVVTIVLIAIAGFGFVHFLHV